MPSGKHAGYENFPVGSWLLPARLRPHIQTFYAFARAMDDIADSSTLSPGEKLERLGAFGDVISGGAPKPGYEKAVRMAISLSETSITQQHCLDLVEAFSQDARQDRYEDWGGLMDYCMKSAAPVGRYLLDLHGCDPAEYKASDALCCALQVINHVQDCGDDYDSLNRVYLPLDWMSVEEAEVGMLGGKVTSPELRRVLVRVLDATDGLLDLSRSLPGRLNSRRLAMEAAVIHRIATALVIRLRRDDPLAGRVVLGRLGYGMCTIQGVLFGTNRARRG